MFPFPSNPRLLEVGLLLALTFLLLSFPILSYILSPPSPPFPLEVGSRNSARESGIALTEIEVGAFSFKLCHLVQLRCQFRICS